MCQRNFTRLRISTSAHKCYIADSVVRTAKRTYCHKCRPVWQGSGYGVYLGGFQRFVQSKRRKYRWNTFGKHSFARTGRTYHNYIVSTGGGNFKCTFNIALPLNIGKIEVDSFKMFKKLFSCVDNSGLNRIFAVKKIYYLLNIVCTIHFEVVNHGSLTSVFCRENNAFEFFFNSLYCNR